MTSALNKDPFRLFFPLGILFLFCGILIWVPRIWNAEEYPILLHRTLVLNGFVSCFIGGFLMTAVPRFSQTETSSPHELLIYLFLISASMGAGYAGNERTVFLLSALTGLSLLVFVLTRIRRRKANPPYSFIFLFIGLILWILSGILSFVSGTEEWKELHYHGSVMAIILGVGSRLLPGIMGHTEIVSQQRELYEKPVSLLKTVPKHFFVLMISYVLAFFLPPAAGAIVTAMVVLIIGLFYWKLWTLPVEKTALTYSLWVTAWLIVLSYLLRAFWSDGMIHGSHAFFINGLVLLTLLIATRVIQSHGPKDKSLENWKGLYFVTFLIFTSSVTRVSAYLMPESYFSHLGYGSVLLLMGAALWSWKYLGFVKETK